MRRSFAAFVVAASLLTLASSEASAWVCFATGLGSSGRARAYDIIDAKLFAAALRAQQPGADLHPLVVPSRRLTIELRNDPSRAARPGRVHFENAPSIAALTPRSASGVSTSTSAALPSSGTSTTASL